MDPRQMSPIEPLERLEIAGGRAGHVVSVCHGI
jgi:hypothetical protein